MITFCFITTDEDLLNLSNPEWRARMAVGIRNGIDAWALEDDALDALRRR